jgi:hypothetical protein
MSKFDITSEFIEDQKKLGQTMPKRKGGRYTKQEKTTRQDEVYRLHFDYGYPARKIAGILNVNKNTINSDIDYWYDKITNRINILEPEDLIVTSIERLNIQRNRLRKQLDKTKSFEETIKIERLLLELDGRISQIGHKLANSTMRLADYALQRLNEFRYEKKNQQAHLEFKTFLVSEEAGKQIDELRERSRKERRRL